MFWGSICVLALAGGTVALLASILPVSPHSLEPSCLRVVRRRRRTFQLTELAPLDHCAPDEPMSVADAHRAQQIHAACPPWLCPAKTVAMSVLTANNRRTPSRTIL